MKPFSTKEKGEELGITVEKITNFLKDRVNLLKKNQENNFDLEKIARDFCNEKDIKSVLVELSKSTRAV